MAIETIKRGNVELRRTRDGAWVSILDLGDRFAVGNAVTVVRFDEPIRTRAVAEQLADADASQRGGYKEVAS